MGFSMQQNAKCRAKQVGKKDPTEISSEIFISDPEFIKLKVTEISITFDWHPMRN
jgi:hypothetical protein